MPVMISSTIRPRSRMTISWRARVSTASIFSERGPRRCCKRNPRNAGERGIVFPHDARKALRISTGRQPFDLALDHQRQHVFSAQGHAAQDDDGQRYNRANEQRPHEEAAPQEELDDGLEGIGGFSKARVRSSVGENREGFFHCKATFGKRGEQVLGNWREFCLLNRAQARCSQRPHWPCFPSCASFGRCRRPGSQRSPQSYRC